METIYWVRGSTIPSPFKSYYVVWKLIDIDAVGERYERFKSYYVVWKRIEPLFFSRAST